MDLSQLRKMRNSSSDLSKLTKAVEQASGTSKDEDNRFWKLEVDKAGNGSATIRFLPKHDKDELPWVRYFHHSFKGPTGKWYIEKSLTTFGEPDPVSEINRELWNTGLESNKKIASAQKRKLSFISNILVIKDPLHPENEGKVFLFKFGKKIFDMISEKLNPTFEDDEPVNVFDLWGGANFKIRQAKVEGYPNYDKSTWDSPSELFDGDEQKLLEVVNSMNYLGELVDRKQFKSYDDLKKRLNGVLDTKSVALPKAADMVEEEDLPWDEEEVTSKNAVKSAPAAKTAKAKPKVEEVDEESDEILSYFQKIANE
jgi:hypothetical protein